MILNDTWSLHERHEYEESFRRRALGRKEASFVKGINESITVFARTVLGKVEIP